ncbi:hypothetical protein EDB19DRAFT_151738 [Suillus lakei]|nr:hypothetical protein EDB19DRAFT_151738 [Suillus lakei]
MPNSHPRLLQLSRAPSFIRPQERRVGIVHYLSRIRTPHPRHPELMQPFIAVESDAMCKHNVPVFFAHLPHSAKEAGPFHTSHFVFCRHWWHCSFYDLCRWVVIQCFRRLSVDFKTHRNPPKMRRFTVWASQQSHLWPSASARWTHPNIPPSRLVV